MMKSKMLFQAGVLAALVTCTSVRAFAQTDATPPPSAPPAATTGAVSSGGGAGNGLGVGAEAWLSGLAGATVVYDQYVWHIQGVIGFDSESNGPGPRTTNVEIGASGWYHLAHGASSDFSLGGGVGFASGSGGGNSVQAFVIEPGAMVRVFLTSNVSLSGRVGLAMAFGDNGTAAGNTSGVALRGQTTTALGFTYFFK
jgi:hypothetical protein